MSAIDFAALLREKGLRATTGRLALLRTLAEQDAPASIERIAELLPARLDTVTLYRALEALRTAGLVERTDLGHGHAHYELLAGRPHHHHAICRSCGTVEDVEIPHAARPEKEAEARTKRFAAIDSYALEFYGTCVACA